MFRFIVIILISVAVVGCTNETSTSTRQLMEDGITQESTTNTSQPSPTVVKANSAAAVTVAPTSTPTPTSTPSPTPFPTRTPTPKPTVRPTSTPVPQGGPVQLMNLNSSSFSCNCSKVCSAMASCEEAYFQLNSCGCGKRDGDNDGVPCENICL